MKRGRHTNRDLELLYEIGCLRFISRFWRRFLNSDFQNLAEHHFRVAWIALMIAKREGHNDLGKVLQLALVHDIAESRTGDTDYISRQYVNQFRELAIKDIVSQTSLESEILELVEDYEKRKSIESKIVKDADTLDVDIELKEQEARGNPIRKEWMEQRKALAKNKLYTKSAQHLWKELQHSNPHMWHTRGRNRFIGGDFKEIISNSGSSQTFVVPTKTLQKKGLISEDKVSYKRIKNVKEFLAFYTLAKKEGNYAERFGTKGVENNPAFKQIVMYAYFQTQDGKILIYTRNSGS